MTSYAYKPRMNAELKCVFKNEMEKRNTVPGKHSVVPRQIVLKKWVKPAKHIRPCQIEKVPYSPVLLRLVTMCSLWVCRLRLTAIKLK